MPEVVQPDGAVTSIPTGAITDQLLSPDGQTLYVARDGTIDAYSLATGSLINSWTVGTQLGGIDLSPDGHFLVATELQDGSDTTFPVYRLDTTTGVSTTYQVPHPPGSYSAGFGDIAILSDGTALLSGTNQWEALTTYNFNTGDHTFSDVAYYPSTFTTSADHSHVLISSDGISDAPIYMYTVGAGVTAAHEGYADNIYGYNSGVQAISPNGNLIAEGVSLAIYDADLHLVTKLSDRYPFFAAGLAFSPDGSKLYVLDSRSNDVFVLSTTTWDVLGGYSVGQSVSGDSWQGAPATPYGNALLVSADGSHIVADTSVFVQVIDLTKAISETGTSAGDDVLTGTGATDTLYGFEGDDTLDGAGGEDFLYGGKGNDRYFVDNENDYVYEQPNQGHDTIYSSAADYRIPASVERLVLTGEAVSGHGNSSANTIVGNNVANNLYGDAGDDLLTGRGGNDILDGGAGNDRVEGGVGDDTYYVDSPSDLVVENAEEGVDTIVSNISLTLAANVENLTLNGVNSFGHGNALANNILGNGTDNALYGEGGNDSLSGNAGDDTLVGGSGDDLLDGGAGNDTASYLDAAAGVTVDLRLATAQNTSGAGSDTLLSIERLTGSAYADQLTGDDLANKLTGLAGDDRLVGDAGNDTLDGGAGNDKMLGGSGNDIYIVSEVGDATYENVGEGTDLVLASVSTALRANVENLTLTGVASLSGKGNDLANSITGNSGANALYGLDGNDILTGNGGRDVLDGGTGNDTLRGGADNDVYVVDSASDVIVENSGEGTDFVRSSVSYTLSANVERIYLTGASAIDATGNGEQNLLVGNGAANHLSGLDNNDHIYGGAGADTLNGGEGNDYLEGGIGQDDLIGGAGKDYFVFRDGDFGGSTAATADRIEDFALGDRISLSPVDANTLAGGNQAFAFIGTAAFDGTAGELRYEQVGGNTFLSADTNGDGTADFMIKLDGLHTLTTSDLLL